MAATFLERVTSTGDFDNDGGALDWNSIYHCVVLFDQDLASASDIKGWLGCTPSQGAELQEILETRPSVLLGSAFARGTWAQRIGSACFAANCHLTGFETANQVRGQLGLD